MSRTRKLDPIEVRVLGALLEKEQTTPDQYPLTINAVIAACNQKTNREPVTSLTETEVVEALDRMREDVLTWRSQGSRVERWQQSVDRRWGLDKRSKAIMTLLLLRGPQTVGELRTRSERMHHFDSVEEVEESLRKLADGFDALVCELPRQPGKRETRWMHLESAEGDPREMEALPVSGLPASSPSVSSPSVSGPSVSGPSVSSPPMPEVGSGRKTPYDERLEAVESECRVLRETVQALESTVSALQAQLEALRTDLGCD